MVHVDKVIELEQLWELKHTHNLTTFSGRMRAEIGKEQTILTMSLKTLDFLILNLTEERDSTGLPDGLPEPKIKVLFLFLPSPTSAHNSLSTSSHHLHSFFFF